MFPKESSWCNICRLGGYIEIVHVYTTLQVECLRTVNKSLVSIYSSPLVLGFLKFIENINRGELTREKSGDKSRQTDKNWQIRMSGTPRKPSFTRVASVISTGGEEEKMSSEISNPFWSSTRKKLSLVTLCVVYFAANASFSVISPFFPGEVTYYIYTGLYLMLHVLT